MIVPMKKVSLVVMNHDREASLQKLRELGVVHLEKKTVESEKLQEFLEQKNNAVKALGLLDSFKTKKKGAVPVSEHQNTAYSAEALTEKVLTLAEDKKSAQDSLASDMREYSRIMEWGNFDPAAFAELAEKGVRLIPYELSRLAYENLNKETRLIVLSKDKNSVKCLVLDEALSDQAPFILPEQSLNELEKKIQDRQLLIASIEKKIRDLSVHIPILEKRIAELLKKIEFETAKESMEFTEEGPENLQVAWLCGYVPHFHAGQLKRAAAENAWAVLIDDVDEADNPPTLVKNNALVRIIKPIFNLLGTVPGYREYDISLSFLIFFALFFAMIFGDAGYGLLLLGVSLFFGFKARARSGSVPDIFLLLTLLSGSTIVWGAINGTWFAIPIETLPPFLQALVIPPFYPDPGMDPKEASNIVQQNIKHFCFIVAAVQLVLAHVKNIRKALPSLTAFAELGWLALTIGFYYLVLNLVLDPEAFPIPSFALYLMGGGLLMYFVFAEQNGGNFFKNILKGFANFLPTFLNAVSGFSDIISYIRLFAVGLAGYAIAESFNGMAMGAAGNILGMIAAVLILVLGHGLNLAMNALSVVVHGVRLNMLEYSGRLGMEWSGVKYAPFAQDERRDL